MGEYVSGAEVDVEELARWSSLEPRVGTLLEVHLPTSSMAAAGDDWALFFILRVEPRLDGSHALACRLLGCSDANLPPDLQRYEMDGVIMVHLCLSRPCVDLNPVVGLHATRIRLWDVEDLRDSREYVPKRMWAELKKWEKALGGTASDPPKKTPRAKGKTPKAKADKAEPRRAAAIKPGAGDRRAPGLGEDMRKELQRRLQNAKMKKGDGEGRTGVAEEPLEAAVGVCGTGRLFCRGFRSGDRRAGGEHKEAPASSRKRGAGTLRTPYADAHPATSGGITKSWSGQLTDKALALTAQRKK